MKLRTRLAVTVFAALLGSLAFAGSASATFHQIFVKEVFLGTGSNDAFVELQMWAAGNNLVNGQQVQIYGADGAFSSESTLDGVNADVDNGQNQRTILIGDTGVEGRDFTYGPMTDVTQFLSGGGALCFEGSLDCVAWGSFSETAGTLPSEHGTPFLPGGIPTGASITRKVTRGCQTALDAKDDTNNSAADFVRTNTPSPRGNSFTPPERPCAGLRCGGKAVTYVGTNGKNVINGTGRADVILGRGGKDTIRGRGGKDTLCGGGGPDRLIGGAGRDKLLGQAGRDILIGGGGNDILRGGPGSDVQKQ